MTEDVEAVIVHRDGTVFTKDRYGSWLGRVQVKYRHPIRWQASCVVACTWESSVTKTRREAVEELKVHHNHGEIQLRTDWSSNT